MPRQPHPSCSITWISLPDIQRYAAEQQYFVYLRSITVTASWQPYVKDYSPNITFDYGSRATALWLDR